MNSAANLDRLNKIAEAVLYEGYMLYPYRASAVKNQQRWNFGVLCPRSFSDQEHGTEAWRMQTECLVESGRSAQLSVKVRFLQIVNRSVGQLAQPLHELPSGNGLEFAIVDNLQVRGRTHAPWQEASEREIALPAIELEVAPPSQSIPFEFPAGREIEPLPDDHGLIVGIIVREWEALSGSVEVELQPSEEGAIKASIRICNLTAPEAPQPQTRADALQYSFASTHTCLTVKNGQFVSLIDPPERLKNLAAECNNIGCWPILVGEEGDRDTMLSSPIIFYDYPQIAAESPGSLFDGTEIDEILSLRILTMTDEEKREMRQSDERACQILERTESMPQEQFMKLHGALRGLHPVGKESR